MLETGDGAAAQGVFVLFVERFGVQTAAMPRFIAVDRKDPYERDRIFVTAGTIDETQALERRLFDHGLIWRSTILCDHPSEAPRDDVNGRLLLDALHHRERLVADAVAQVRS